MEKLFDLLNFNVSEFIFQCINIGIMIFFIRKFLFQKVMAFIDDRNKEVNNSYKEINEAWDEIKHNENKYNGLLGNIENQKAELNNQAKTEGNMIKQKYEQEAKNKAEEEIARARSIIENERAQAMEMIRKDVSELVLQGTEAVLRKEVSRTDHQPMIDEFVENLGGRHE